MLPTTKIFISGETIRTNSSIQTLTKPDEETTGIKGTEQEMGTEIC